MKPFYKLLCLFMTVVLTAGLWGCFPARQNSEPVTVSGFKLNTYVSVTAYSKCDEKILTECLALCDKYERIFSRTLESSLLYQLNNGTLTENNEDLYALVAEGLAYSKESLGSFDISIGAVSQLWDFTAQTPQVPDAADIEKMLPLVDYTKISADPVSHKITMPEGFVLDLGAIAKGYIADKMKAFLLENGVTNAIINLGGNVLCVGKNANGNAFKIAVKKPFTDSDSVAVLQIDDMSVVSSGTYERYFTYEDKFYHHILNPASGYPYENGLSGVTIISKSSTQGDALSTLCFSLGLEKGLAYINALDGVEAIFITDDGSVYYSSGCDKYIP